MGVEDYPLQPTF